jgi:alpha-beta hydrolase superfamily lysophospholipase
MEQMGIQMLVQMIIRPPRNPYPSDAAQNGSVRSFGGGKNFVKKVFTVNNEAGQALSCLFYEPKPDQRPQEKMPVVIYMHGNAGCKLEGEELAKYLLPQGINLFAFDFSGCG